jgi:hypothetical protein
LARDQDVPWKTIPALKQRRCSSICSDSIPGRFPDGSCGQSKVKNWRAQEGPAREVYFPQVHTPGRLSQSDFTHMGSLGITIGSEPFDHLIYHFVLTFFQLGDRHDLFFLESFESLRQGCRMPCGPSAAFRNCIRLTGCQRRCIRPGAKKNSPPATSRS